MIPRPAALACRLRLWGQLLGDSRQEMGGPGTVVMPNPTTSRLKEIAMTAQTMVQQAPALTNGVNVGALFETIKAIKAKPGRLARFQFRARNQWMGADHNRSTIQNFYGACQEQMTRTRPYVLDNGEPAALARKPERRQPGRVRAQRARRLPDNDDGLSRRGARHRNRSRGLLGARGRHRHPAASSGFLTRCPRAIMTSASGCG